MLPSSPSEAPIRPPPRVLSRLRALPWWLRVLLWVGLSVGTFYGPCVRLATMLSIGTITEAYPWMLWGEGYLELARNLYTIARPVLLGAVTICTTWLLFVLLFPRSRTPRPALHRLLRWLPRAAAGLVALVAFSILALPLTVNSVRAARTFPPRTSAVVLENCGHCHSPYRPQHFVRTAAQWRRTVTRMRERNGAPVNDQQAEEVIAWLSDYRGFSDAWMFRAKCLRCHGEHHLRETPRTAEEWAFVVDRLAWVSTFGYRVDHREQIERHLADDLSIDPPAPGTPEARALEDRLLLQTSCNPCHSISLVLEKGALDEPRAMVERMSYKDPTLVKEEDIDRIVEALEALPTTEAGFWRLFPHDILLDVR